MASRTTFRELLEEAKADHEYVAHRLSLDFSIHLSRAMKEKGLTRSALAEKLGCKPAYVTKVLRGDENFTLNSMAKLAHAVDLDLKLDVRHPKKSHKTVTWLEGSHLPSVPNRDSFATEDITATSAVNDDEYSSIAA
jgi:transcriptional regulator with XRE-family HTH domain